MKAHYNRLKGCKLLPFFLFTVPSSSYIIFLILCLHKYPNPHLNAPRTQDTNLKLSDFPLPAQVENLIGMQHVLDDLTVGEINGMYQLQTTLSIFEKGIIPSLHCKQTDSFLFCFL